MKWLYDIGHVSGVRRTDGEILIATQGEYFLYGNDVKPDIVNITEPPTGYSVLDVAHPLPFGQLTNFYVYASAAAASASRPIQLQIWRRVFGGAYGNYRLVWQRLALVNTSSSTGALLTVSIIFTLTHLENNLTFSHRKRTTLIIVTRKPS